MTFFRLYNICNNGTLYIRSCEPLLKTLKYVVFVVLHRVALVIPDVSDELSASIIRVTRIGELGTTVAVTSDRRTLRRNIFNNKRINIS
jgi:hypothetical protein